MNKKTNHSLLFFLIFISVFSIYYFGYVSEQILYIDSNRQLAQVSSLGNGLVSHYKFDDGSGTIAIDSASGNNGTLINGPVWTSGSVGSGALQFDGVDDYVNSGDVNALDNISQLSVSYWVNLSSLQLRDYHVSKVNGANSTYGWAIHATDDTDDIRFETRNPVGTVAEGYTTNSVLKNNVWTHIAVIFDGTQADNVSKLKIFIDGSQKVLTFRGTLPVVLPDTAFNLVIGWEHNKAPGLSVGGLIDDVRIYNRTLSSSEIGELYSDQPPVSVPVNQAPVVSAGNNQTVTLPSTASLNGSSSDDGLPNGAALTYSWSTVSGGGVVTFSNSTSLSTTASFSQAGVYVLRLTSSDSSLSSSSDITITVNSEPVIPPPDTLPPSVPSSVSAIAISASQIDLSWNSSTDNIGVSGYKIYRDNVEINSTSGVSFQDTGLSPETTYSYKIAAFDSSNNLSGESSVVSIKTKSLNNNIPVTDNNILKNSSFETPGDNFWGFGGSKINETDLSSDAFHGNYSLKWPYINDKSDVPYNNPTSGQYQNTLSYQSFIAEPGSTYTMSAYMKYTVGGGQVEFRLYDSVRNRSAFTKLLATSPKMTLTNSWKRYDWTLTLPPSTDNKYVIRIVFPGDPPWMDPYPVTPRVAGLIDAIKFEKGVLTDYSTNLIEVGLYPNADSNAFNWGSDVSMNFYLSNNGADIFNSPVDIVVEDFFGNNALEKTLNIVAHPSQRVKQLISLGNNLKGHFRVIVKINNVIKTEKIFSTIPLAKNINPDDSIYGICSNLYSFNLDQSKRLGIKRIRPQGDFEWSAIETSRGVFKYPDYRVSLAKSKGIQPYGFLHSTPSWAGPYSTGLPSSLSDWENFVFNVVDHYKNDIKYWEIYNEPYSINSNTGLQQMKSSEYLSLVQSARKGMERADPSAKLIGWSGTISLLPGANYPYKDVKDQLIQNLDVLSAHYYPTYSPLTGTAFYDTLKNHSQVVSGGKMSVWNTEGGALGGGTFYRTKNDFDPNDSRNSNTSDMVKYFVNHKIASSPLYYYWSNFPSTGDHSPGFSYSWTLNEYDGSLKASAVSMAVSAYFLDGSDVNFDGYVASGNVVNDESVVMPRFKKDENNSIVVAWTDVVGKTVVIKNSLLPQDISIYDMFGKNVANFYKGQGFVFTITNNPVYIVINNYSSSLVDKTFLQFGFVSSSGSYIISEKAEGDKNPQRVNIYGSYNSLPSVNEMLYSQMVPQGSDVVYGWDAPVRLPDQDTLLLYHFDQRADMGESSTTVRDFSSNNRWGSLVSTNSGTLEFSDNYGKFAGGLKGDGSFWNKNIKIDNDLGLNNLTQFTIEMWLKSASVSGSKRLFSKGDVSSASLDLSPYAARIRETGREIIFQVSDGSITRERYSSVKFPADNTFHHLAFVFDGAPQQELRKMDIYMDGKLINGNLTGSKDGKCPIAQSGPSPSCQIPGFTKNDNSNFYILGFSGATQGSLWNGYIDEFVMYDRALSPVEILNHAKLNTNQTYYWFTEFIGNTITKTIIKNSKNYTKPQMPQDPPLVVDLIPPSIFNISSSDVAQSSVAVTFSTNEPSDSQIEYGLTSGYGNKTSINSVFSSVHSRSITGLSPNTTYHFRILSKDSSGNLSISNDGTFTTLNITQSSNNNSNYQSLPSNYRNNLVDENKTQISSTTTSIQNSQAQATSTPVFTRNLKIGQLGNDVRELQKILNELGYTVSLSGPGSVGNETNIFGLATESAIKKYQCNVLNICSGAGFGYLDQNTRDALNKVAKEKVKNPVVQKIKNTYTFVRTLRIGQKGDDVKELQKFLNNNGFVVAISGPGSVDNETNYFGPATFRALIKFQEAYKSEILTPFGISKGTGFFGVGTMKKINSFK